MIIVPAVSPTIAPMGVPRETHSATLLKNGKVLIAGGGRGGMPGGYIAYTTAEIFDPASNTFTTLAAHMTTDRVAPAAALLDDGRVLIAGGKSGKIRSPFGGTNLFYFTPLETAEVFDPETSSFLPVGSMETPHYLGVATKLNDGMVLITGGWTANGGMIGGVRTGDLFDPNAECFHRRRRASRRAAQPDRNAARERRCDGRGWYRSRRQRHRERWNFSRRMADSSSRPRQIQKPDLNHRGTETRKKPDKTPRHQGRKSGDSTLGADQGIAASESAIRCGPQRPFPNTK